MIGSVKLFVEHLSPNGASFNKMGELFAYAMETAKGGVDNELSKGIYVKRFKT